MRPLVRDFLVGATFLLGITGLILSLLFFGELEFDRSYDFKIRVSNASGLAQASRITMNGVNIGQVKKASILPPDVGGVELSVSVREFAQIPKLSTVAIDKGLIGDAALDFSVPANLSKQQLADVIKPGDYFEGGSPRSPLDKLVASIDEPIATLNATAKRIEELSVVYTDVGRKINEALEPRTLADVAAGKQPNIRTLIERVDKALASADTFINDGELRQQIKEIVAKAHTTMNDASDLVATIKSSAAKADKVVDSADATLKSIQTAATDASTNIASISTNANSTLKGVEEAAGKLSEVLDKASRGDGTMGQLMNNPDLYNSLRDAAVRLDKALNEFQLLAEKFKAEGVRLRL